MAKLRYIVSRDEPKLYEYLKQHFSGDDAVDVIYDRRERGVGASDGSSDTAPGASDRRTGDAVTTLRGIGWAIVQDRDAWPSSEPVFDQD